MGRSFDRSFVKLLGLEGSYSNHPQDPGGKTKYGITEEVAKENGYKGDMKDLPESFAKRYYEELWDKLNLTKVAGLNEDVAFEVFEASVHLGSSVAVKFFQRALNVFNRQGDIYKDIKVDGIIGDKTIAAFEDFHGVRGLDGCKVISKAVKGQKASYFVRLAEENSKLENFVYGWISRRT